MVSSSRLVKAFMDTEVPGWRPYPRESESVSMCSDVFPLASYLGFPNILQLVLFTFANFFFLKEGAQSDPLDCRFFKARGPLFFLDLRPLAWVLL